MVGTQQLEEETPNPLEHQQAQENTDDTITTPNTDQQNAALNPVVELTRTDVDNMEEYIRRHGEIGLDWYVPDIRNTHVKDLIKTRLQIETGKGKILFNCPQLRDLFSCSNFELDLVT